MTVENYARSGGKITRDDVGLLVTAMKSPPYHAGVQEVGRAVIGHFACSRKTVKQTGCVGIILTAMRRHDSSAPVQMRAFFSLNNISIPLKGNVKIASEGGAGTIIAAMRHFADNPKIQEKGSKLLGTLADGDYCSKINIPSEGGVGAILNAMQRFPDNADVQRSVVFALYLFDYRNDTCFKIISEGGIPVLVNATRQHLLDEELNRIYFQMLYSLARSSDNHVKQLESAGAVDVVQAALKAHPRMSQLGSGISRLLQPRTQGSSPSMSTRAALSLEVETKVLRRRA